MSNVDIKSFLPKIKKAFSSFFSKYNKYSQIPLSYQEDKSNNFKAIFLALIIAFFIGYFGYRFLVKEGIIKKGETKLNYSLVENVQKPEILENAASSVRLPSNEQNFDSKENNEQIIYSNVKGTEIEEKEVLDTTWIANDYKAGQISKGTYQVKSGDTLWEIAEAVYGNGNEWNRIASANADSISLLPNGQQALIFAGQSIVIP